MDKEQDAPLQIGDICEALTDVYKGVQVKITRLPDKRDARYSVSRDGFGGLRFHRSELRLIRSAQEQNGAAQ